MQPSPESAPLEIDRVEWVPASPESVRVHLLGRWIDRPVAKPLILLVGTGRRRLPFDALPDPPRGVLVAFAVPNELRARLNIDIALQIGAHELALPPATPGAVSEPEPEEAEVIDRAVLAERRARRAELAEEQLSDRARDAEQAAETLEAQLANLEERLEQARDERDELEAQLADAERRLKAAQQREYAEQQQRIEAEDELERLRRSDDDVVADLRSRLEAATERAEEMARELEQARRAAAEALHRGAADRAAIEREARAEADEAAAVEREAAQARIAQLEREVATREEVHTRIVGELGQLREQLHTVSAVPTAEAEERRRAAEFELVETRSILTERTAELELARLDLARLEQEAEALRTSAHRHDAAMEEANRTIEAVRASATELQLALDAERRERARAEAVLHEELARARAEGRTEAETVQAELRGALDAERRRFVTEVAAIEHQVTALREQVASATAELRAALDAERAARLSAERQLAAERARHGVNEVERDAVIQQLVTQILGTAASLRDAFEEESRKLESELTAQVAEERARMAAELAAMEARLTDLGTMQPPPAAPEPPPAPEPPAPVETPAAEVAAPAPEPAPEPAAPKPDIVRDLSSAAERLRDQTPPLADETPGEVLAPRVVPIGVRPTEGWLAGAIGALAEREPVAAARLIAALLPVQGLYVHHSVAYDLTLHDLGTYRVFIERGAVTVEEQAVPEPSGDIDFHLDGPAALLAPLVAGEAPRRPKGLQFFGSKRRLKAMLRELREPVHLHDVARSGTIVEPGLLLAGLAAGIDRTQVAGHAFSIAWHVSGRDAGVWTVTIAGGAATVSAGEPEGGATGTVHVPQPMLLPLLAGTPAPRGLQATATGDIEAISLLRTWFDRVQKIG